MSKIDSSPARSSFFPKSKDANQTKARGVQRGGYIQRNAPSRMKELESTTKQHAKVEIPNAVRDYAKIKKAVDAAPEVDNTEKIARLKQQIQSGSYNVDYDKLADKILSSEF